jgi:hypothetical protein
VVEWPCCLGSHTSRAIVLALYLEWARSVSKRIGLFWRFSHLVVLAVGFSASAGAHILIWTLIFEWLSRNKLRCVLTGVHRDRCSDVKDFLFLWEILSTLINLFKSNFQWRLWLLLLTWYSVKSGFLNSLIRQRYWLIDVVFDLQRSLIAETDAWSTGHDFLTILMHL